MSAEPSNGRLAAGLPARPFGVPAVPVLLFIVALVPRIIGSRWGLPNATHWYSYHPDEKQITDAVTALYGDGHLNPHFFNYPSLYIYLVYAAHVVASGLGWVPSVAVGQPWPWLHGILLPGRLITAVLGAATVPVTYALGRRASEAIGVWAALFLTFLPGHVQHSHFATVDVPATFFITVSLWLAVRAADVPAPRQARRLMASAFVAGLAAATKYNAGLVILAPLAVAYQQRGTSGLKWQAPLWAAAVLGFVAGCPYSVLSFREFWGDGQYSGFAYEVLVHPRQGSGEVFQGTGVGWWYHLTFNLPFVMTWPLLGAALAGVVMVWRQRQAADAAQRTLIFAVLLWSAVYFLPLGLSQVRYMRYVLPLTPALCLLAAIGVQYVTGRAATVAVPAANTLLFLIALMGTANVLYPFVSTDPRDQAARFIMAQTTSGASVGLLSLPWFWTPPLTPQDAPPPAVPSPELLLNLSDACKGRYRFSVTGFVAAALDQDRPQWFVMDELEWREQARLGTAQFKQFMDRLARTYALRASFKNVPPLALPGRSFVPHDYLYSNPEIRVYQRR